MTGINSLLAGDMVLDDELVDRLGDFMRLFERCTSQQQWFVIYRLLHARMGENPSQDAVICSDCGESYVLLTTIQSACDRLLPDKSTMSFGEEPTVALGEVLEILHSCGDPQTIAERVDGLRATVR